MEKLKWNNLIEGLCPKCGMRLYDEDAGVNCSSISSPTPCEFFITQEKLQELLKSMNNKRNIYE